MELKHNSLQASDNKGRPSSRSQYLPSSACCDSTAPNSVVQDLDLFPRLSPAVSLHPHDTRGSISYPQVCQSSDVSIQGETIISGLCHRACPELRQTFYPVSLHNDLFGYQCVFLKSFKLADTTWGDAPRNELRRRVWTFPLSCFKTDYYLYWIGQLQTVQFTELTQLQNKKWTSDSMCSVLCCCCIMESVSSMSCLVYKAGFKFCINIQKILQCSIYCKLKMCQDILTL